MFKSYYIEDINFCRANICEFSEFWSISLKSKIKFRIFLDAYKFNKSQILSLPRA